MHLIVYIFAPIEYRLDIFKLKSLDAWYSNLVLKILLIRD